MLKATKGGTPEALFGTGADGKGSKRQSLGRGEKDVITGSGGIARSMGNYSKAPPAYLAPGGASEPPTHHPAMNEVRGGSGGMKTHPKMGGIGPGTMGAIGPANPDSMKDPDLT